jgi:hypothetical protein
MTQNAPTEAFAMHVATVVILSISIPPNTRLGTIIGTARTTYYDQQHMQQLQGQRYQRCQTAA